MKKSILAVVITVLSMGAAVAQSGSFSAGINGGIPVGDAEDLTTFQIGANVAYRFSLGELFEVGGLVGYSHFFGESMDLGGGVTLEVDDVQFIPVATTARVNFNSFFAGADVGYAIGISDGNDGGFYYRPQVGYSFGKFGVVASYQSISDSGFTIASVNLGLEIKF